MTRLAVFIDYQNAYMLARSAFGDPPNDRFTFGQVHPDRLDDLLTRRGQAADRRRHLAFVRVYRGEPEARLDPRGKAAFKRQVRRWAVHLAVEPRTRPYRYRTTARTDGTPVRWEAREKGIDVLIATDMVMSAFRDEYDVAVLFSADTDLIPALESVVSIGKRVEVGSWRPDRGYQPRLTVRGMNIWCHWLDCRDFEAVRDDTDYTRPIRR